MCTLAQFPFEEVAGVELSWRLACIAEANGRKLGFKNFRVLTSDVADFTDFDRFTHVYMYNPFPPAVMAVAMHNLAASLKRKPRKLTVIYHFPTCHSVLMLSGLFGQHQEISVKAKHPYFVYVHDTHLDEGSNVQHLGRKRDNQPVDHVTRASHL